jgi:hypothetical protein
MSAAAINFNRSVQSIKLEETLQCRNGFKRYVLSLECGHQRSLVSPDRPGFTLIYCPICASQAQKPRRGDNFKKLPPAG